jgi:transglutaminase-like putative cysteine protease
MPQVRVAHTTEYRYARPVRFTAHRLMLRPRDSHDLRLTNAVLGLLPAPTATRWAHDVFGNSVCSLEWGEVSSDVLRIVSTLDLDHYPAAPQDPADTLEPFGETFPFSYSPDEVPDLSRCIERHYPDPERRVDGWVRRFLNRGAATRTMDLLIALTEAIKGDFTYESRVAEGTNPPSVTLETRRGACRDFALLMMEAARTLGFAARFVSGYLYDEALADTPNGQEPVVGGGSTHAWAAIYLPGPGWVEFDPTNGLVAGRNLIRVCTARSPGQAVPVAGGFIGQPGDFLKLDVDVEVTVGAPAPPSEPTTPALAPAEPDVEATVDTVDA